MNTFKQPTTKAAQRISVALSATALTLLCAQNSAAYPVSETVFHSAAPFVGSAGVHSLTSGDGLFTVEAWADAQATVPANIWQWWWCFGVDSGSGNGALIDGNESMTLTFDKSVGASLISFFYTGGDGGANKLARLSISGFSSNPGAAAVTASTPRISNLTFANGTLTFDYLDDAASDYGILVFSNSAASAGARLRINGAVSPAGDLTSWHASLFQVDVQEAFGGPQFSPTSVPVNSLTTITSQDGLLTIRGFSDPNATTPANLGRYQDECFGVYSGNVVAPSQSVTLQFAAGIGLYRLDSAYSGGTVLISGFLSDPGLVDTSSGGQLSNYADGVLALYGLNGGFHSFYFTSLAASAGQTLRINAGSDAGSQFGIAGISYATTHTWFGIDTDNTGVMSQTTPDGLLTLNAFFDLAGTSPGLFYGSGDWFGITGGNNNEAIESTESLQLHFAATSGLSAIGTRYTGGQIIISGFASNPGFSDRSGTATDIRYANGTLSYTFNATSSPERVVLFTNLTASLGRTLSLHTGSDSGQQISLTRIGYAVQPPTISVAKSGDNIIVSWTAGTLLESDSVNGTYAPVQNAASPLTLQTSATQKFYRVMGQP